MDLIILISLQYSSLSYRDKLCLQRNLVPFCYAAHGNAALPLYSWMNSFIFLKVFLATGIPLWDHWDICACKRERLLRNMNGACDKIIEK